ncbi:putative uncharacterized protein [Aliivibrio wodanis]|uniref:Uncharacterized protein n=1 Tax=Aliivibrio wodanis TaxID=80852 RepID=A0A090I758_9GAMM|nr:putative uncharacterized protein [Aliivibrio wodanis]
MKNCNNSKSSLVVGLTPHGYKISDLRMTKPTFHFVKDGSGSMLIQELDTVKLNRSRKISYFVPNNIGMLISISSKASNRANKIFNQKFKNSSYELDVTKLTGNKNDAISAISTDVYDYIEEIQSAIVFAYTALEAFANLSIPQDYVYQIKKNSKGISESYDKTAIERWLSLKTKIKSILPELYGTSVVDKHTWWGQFVTLEEYRNEIIHQKSIGSTEFYKPYFKDSIFNIINCIESVISFFYVAHHANGKTNEVWPWLKEHADIPSVEFQQSQFEVTGNVYQGFK